MGPNPIGVVSLQAKSGPTDTHQDTQAQRKDHVRTQGAGGPL